MQRPGAIFAAAPTEQDAFSRGIWRADLRLRWRDTTPLYIHRFRSMQKAYSDVYTHKYKLLTRFPSPHPERETGVRKPQSHCLHYIGCVKRRGGFWVQRRGVFDLS